MVVYYQGSKLPWAVNYAQQQVALGGLLSIIKEAAQRPDRVRIMRRFFYSACSFFSEAFLRRSGSFTIWRIYFSACLLGIIT